MAISKRYKIDLLYKNLQHITYATFSAEAAFPYWETLYALIIGQLLITYFQPAQLTSLLNLNSRLLISIVGFMFSACWFILVLLNHLHSLYRSEMIETLQTRLDGEYKTLKFTNMAEACNLTFIPEDIPEDKRGEWLSWNKIKKESVYHDPASTWFYRKMLPQILCALWVVLFLLTVKYPFHCLR